MRFFTLAFLLGILLLQCFSKLPGAYWLVALIPFAIIFRKKLLTGTILGFSWALLYAHAALSWTLPPNLEGKPLAISGYIKSIPNQTQFQTSFIMHVNKFNTNIRLNWPSNKIHLSVGDEWHFVVKLKRIHSLRNPGSADFEAWAMQAGVRATGVILKSTSNKLISSHWYHSPLNRIRQNLKEKIEINLPHTITSPWIVALALGERNNIAPEYWQVLRNTGTNHLMAIAGLHIGFMAGFIYFFVNKLWRRFPNLMLRIPAQHAGAIASLLMALLYSALAGFSIPTQRACIMLTTFMLILLLRRKSLSWHAWCAAMLIVLLINPMSVLTESFWLSFGSVALIIYGVSGRLAPKGWWWKWGRIQWVIALGLLPLSIWLFQQFSIVAFVANSIAIPWVGFVIVPLTLFGSLCLFFSAKLGTIILQFADLNLGYLWHILTYFSGLNWSVWYKVVPNIWIIASCVGVLILLIPRGFSGRWLGMIWILPLVFYKPTKPANGDMWFTLLDVGQGLSAVVQTQKHILVFDTGSKLGASLDMSESVVTPFLRSIGANKIDMLVLSHGDNDHAGGVKTLVNNFKITSIVTSDPVRIPVPTSLCLRGYHWQWDGVEFSFLHPSPDTLHLNNDSSCVLKIVSRNQSVLLTGDIEKNAEKYLHVLEGKNLSAKILVAPHHGSKTSAMDEFIRDVNPKYVLYATGYRNRYHFPHQQVIDKYTSLGIQQLDTVNTGAMQFRDRRIARYRADNRHFWHY